jgi:heme o synthase
MKHLNHRLSLYYNLTKPGIIRGNLLAATAGFLLASGTDIDFWLLLAMWAGTSLVIASGCVFNNYLDQGIDKKMERTKKRALITGEISARAALVYGTVLGLAGLAVLALWVNWLTVGLGVLGLFFYVVVYGIAKRRSVLGTVVGSISGALPPAAGYTAVSNQLDAGALLLFLVLVCWQMPHFYAIAMFRHKEYAAAGLPVLPVVKGMHAAKIQIMWYIVAFIGAAMLLPLYGYVGPAYVFAVGLIGLAWLAKGWAGFAAADDVKWARGMFFFSLSVLLVFCISIAFDALLR